jgi:ABC-type branched-subunit amino acid transport system permease subunit
MRAVVESPRMTELAGIRADRVSAFAWALSSVFAGMAGVLIAPRFNTLAAADFFNLVVVAIAAAALGRLVSLPRALIGGLALGIFIALLNTFLPRWSADNAWLEAIQENIAPAVPFVVLFGVLVLWPAIRRTREAADPLAGVDPPPPAPVAATRSRGLTVATRVFALGFFGIVGLIIFFRADQSWVFVVTQAVIFATIYLSITVITGFAGQISLCQGAFAAIGGFTVFQLADRYDMSVMVAALIGAAVAAACGALLSLPVLRLGGVWFAIATLAFAFFFDSVMVKLSWIGGGDTALLEGTRVPRPTIGPWDFANDLSFLGLALAVFVLASIAVIRIREGTVGRTLQALRGSEVAAASIGISPARARIVAFAVSAFIAGLGGAMLSMLQENVNYTNSFAPFTALFWLVLVVALGSRTVEGAAIAGASFALFDVVILRGELLGWILRSPDRIPGIFPISPKWRLVLFGLLTIQFAHHPEGLVENGKRQWMRRLERRAGPRTGPSDRASVGELEPAATDAAVGADAAETEGDAATVGAEESR